MVRIAFSLSAPEELETVRMLADTVVAAVGELTPPSRAMPLQRATALGVDENMDEDW